MLSNDSKPTLPTRWLWESIATSKHMSLSKKRPWTARFRLGPLAALDTATESPSLPGDTLPCVVWGHLHTTGDPANGEGASTEESAGVRFVEKT